MKSARRRSASSSSLRARSDSLATRFARADYFERAQRGILRGRRSARAVSRTAGFAPGERDSRACAIFSSGSMRVMNAIDAAPLTTIAAVHGVTFGGGFELALACDLIVADKMTRFCFPELRLGLIPGFGGIPRLKRDLGNAVVRDLLLTGRSINATKAQSLGLVSQVTGGGRRAARGARDGGAAGEIRPRNGASRRSGSSSRSRAKSCGARSIFSASCSCGRRSRQGCASSWRARTRCRICRDAGRAVRAD